MTEQPTKEDLVVTRIFDAPLELVWRAWTDPNEVRRWWGPKDYTSPRAASTCVRAADTSSACRPRLSKAEVEQAAQAV
ncbi:MAG: SRPBCC domain-containing protein [Anaerolineae bacterium]